MGLFDTALGIHERALTVHSQRATLIATNLANADTPNFKARDLDFREVLNRTSPTVRLATTHEGHLSESSRFGDMHAKYRIPFNPSLDGNTVEADAEQSAFSENTVRYQASLSFLSGRIRGIRDAITGGQ